MCRLILICLSTILIMSCFFESATPVRLYTKGLFKQSFNDGFWRALAGKLAVVTYHPVRKGDHVYYVQVPHYLSKHGHGHHGYHGHGGGHGLHAHGNTAYGVPGNYGYPGYSH